MSLICPLCSGNKTKRRFSKQDSTIFKCKICSFIFSTQIGNPNFNKTLSEFEESYQQYFDEKETDEKNFQILLKWINHYTDFISPSLLDIGCGSGKFVNFLNKNGISASGIEPSKSIYSRYLSKNANFDCSQVNEYLIYNPTKNFDIITVIDVLEHIEEPLLFLNSIANLMHKDSVLFISTPDVNSLHQKLTGKYWHYFNSYHFSLFSEKTLRLAAKKQVYPL